MRSLAANVGDSSIDREDRKCTNTLYICIQVDAEHLLIPAVISGPTSQILTFIIQPRDVFAHLEPEHVPVDVGNKLDLFL